MTPDLADKNRRILVIDDNQAIHEDFRKILRPQEGIDLLTQAEAAIFGEPPKSRATPFSFDSAYQGLDGVELARKAAEVVGGRT